MSKPFVKHILSNGLRVILVPRAESLATTILIMAETGSKYEIKEKNGLSHFFEHMCFKGTKRRPKQTDISEQFDSLGANFNAFTSQEYTGYYATFAPKSVDPALDILADMYLNSQFPEAEIDKERGVIMEEINMYEDLPMRNVGGLLMSTIYGDQPAGWQILGTKETVGAIRRQDFLDYQRENYRASATVVVVAGKFNETAIVKKLTRQFVALPAGVKPKKLLTKEEQTRPQAAFKFKQSDQTHLCFGLRGYSVVDSRHYATEMLAAILGGGMSSRLFRKIRDELGAAYYVRANNDAYTDHGLIEIAVGADNRRAEEIVKVILAELDCLRQKLVSVAELERVKESMLGGLSLSLETSSGLANFYAGSEVLEGKLWSPAAVAKKIRAVTTAEIRAVAREVIVNDRLNLALIGPIENQEPFVKALKV
jgi:predicted Zn-dependent peptidase